MDIKSELIENLKKWFVIIKSNDDALILDNKCLFDDFSKISKFIEKNGVKNISKEAAIYFLKMNQIVFFEFFLLSKFFITKIPDIAFYKLTKVRESNPGFFNFLTNFFNSFLSEYKVQTLNIYDMEWFLLLNKTINWWLLEKEDRDFEKDKIETFKKNISEFNDFEKEYEGELLLVAIVIWKQNLKIEDIIEILSESQKESIKLFCISQNSSPLAKIIRDLLIDMIWKKRLPDKNLYHYTNLKGLSGILEGNNLKFSRMDNLNDKDELKLLEYSNNIPYSFSMTTIDDGINLFGNYTEMNGISLEIDFQILTQSLLVLVIDTDTNNDSSSVIFSFIPLKFNFIQYDNSPKDVISEKTKYLKKLFSWLDFGFLDFSIEKATEYLCPFFKKTVWKDESEFRIIIDNAFEDTEKLVNAETKNNQLFVDINARKLIKKIIVGPKIKQSDSKMKDLEDYLKKVGAGHIVIVKTEANVDLGKLK